MIKNTFNILPLQAHDTESKGWKGYGSKAHWGRSGAQNTSLWESQTVNPKTTAKTFLKLHQNTEQTGNLISAATLGPLERSKRRLPLKTAQRKDKLTTV